MAIKNPNTNEYIVVENVIWNNITIRLHKDEWQRQRFKSFIMDKFEITIQETIRCEIDWTKEVDSTKSIKDNTIILWYDALKQKEEFVDYIDC